MAVDSLRRTRAFPWILSGGGAAACLAAGSLEQPVNPVRATTRKQKPDALRVIVVPRFQDICESDVITAHAQGTTFTSLRAAGMIWDMALPPESSFDAMQRAVVQNQRFLKRWPVQMKAASAVQLMKRKREAAPSGSGKPPGKPPDDGNAPKKAKEKEEEESVFEKKVRMIHAIIGMIIARLNGGNQAPPRIPTLSSMASRSLADQLPGAMGPDKRG